MTNRTPAVSVIIPTYNRASLLERSVKSVLGQTYSDFELIIVDDGSTDGTSEVVGRFSDNRIRYLRLEENRGASFARNLGIRNASGRYIAFQDSDDEWIKEKLEKQVQILAGSNSDIGIVYSGYRMIRDGKMTYLPSPDIRPKHGDLKGILLRGNFITTQTVLVRAECLAKSGLFDEKLPRLQDWELWLRIAESHAFGFVDEPLVTSYFQPESITANEDKLVEAFEMILEKHHESFIESRKALAHLYFLIGTHLLYSGRKATRERKYLMEAMKLNPMRLEHVAYAMISLFGKANFDRARKLYRMLRGFSGRNQVDSPN